MKKSRDMILVTFFGDVITITPLKQRHNRFFQFDFVIISLKKNSIGQNMQI